VDCLAVAGPGDLVALVELFFAHGVSLGCAAGARAGGPGRRRPSCAEFRRSRLCPGSRADGAKSQLEVDHVVLAGWLLEFCGFESSGDGACLLRATAGTPTETVEIRGVCMSTRARRRSQADTQARA
jgi:hypothetical protein